jgi:hypothetical protein
MRRWSTLEHQSGSGLRRSGPRTTEIRSHQVWNRMYAGTRARAGGSVSPRRANGSGWPRRLVAAGPQHSWSMTGGRLRRKRLRLALPPSCCWDKTSCAPTRHSVARPQLRRRGRARSPKYLCGGYCSAGVVARVSEVRFSWTSGVGAASVESKCQRPAARPTGSARSAPDCSLC